MIANMNSNNNTPVSFSPPPPATHTTYLHCVCTFVFAPPSLLPFAPLLRFFDQTINFCTHFQFLSTTATTPCSSSAAPRRWFPAGSLHHLYVLGQNVISFCTHHFAHEPLFATLLFVLHHVHLLRLLLILLFVPSRLLLPLECVV